MQPFHTTQAWVPPGVIDFGIGQPVNSLLPLAIFQRATAQHLAQGDPSLLQYGFEPGDDYFRYELARFISQSYGLPTTLDQLFITNGTSQGLDMVGTLFAQPGDVIFVEEPTYFLAFQIFRDHGLQLVSIPCDEHGLRIDALESALRTQRPAFVYTIPTHQNPTGATLPLDRRQRLVELSQQHGFLIVADEVYHLLSYGAAPPPSFASFVQSGSVLSLGTFSKILAPGLRLGWVQTTPKLVDRLVESGMVGSGGGLNPFTASLVRVILEQGWQHEYLAELRTIYGRRLRLMSRLLHEQIGGRVSFAEPDGGYFFWLKLHGGIDCAELQARAQQHKVNFRLGSKFSSHGGLRDYLRLSFAYYEDAQIVEGISQLAQAFE